MTPTAGKNKHTYNKSGYIIARALRRYCLRNPGKWYTAAEIAQIIDTDREKGTAKRRARYGLEPRQVGSYLSGGYCEEYIVIDYEIGWDKHRPLLRRYRYVRDVNPEAFVGVAP